VLGVLSKPASHCDSGRARQVESCGGGCVQNGDARMWIPRGEAETSGYPCIRALRAGAKPRSSDAAPSKRLGSNLSSLPSVLYRLSYWRPRANLQKRGSTPTPLLSCSSSLARTYRIRYISTVSPAHKPLVFLSGATIKTPPLTAAARGEVGYLLRQLQAGESLALPRSRPMPSIGARCHELRVQDETVTWRLVYRIDLKAIVVVEVFTKKTPATPRTVIDTCQKRLRAFDQGT
jgi:phage-related protein